MRCPQTGYVSMPCGATNDCPREGTVMIDGFHLCEEHAERVLELFPGEGDDTIDWPERPHEL